MLIKFNFIKIWKPFSTVFPWIWSLSRDSTKLNNFSCKKNFDAVSWCEDETKKSCFLVKPLISTVNHSMAGMYVIYNLMVFFDCLSLFVAGVWVQNKKTKLKQETGPWRTKLLPHGLCCPFLPVFAASGIEWKLTQQKVLTVKSVSFPS